jgi:hypothetical protein
MYHKKYVHIVSNLHIVRNLSVRFHGVWGVLSFRIKITSRTQCSITKFWQLEQLKKKKMYFI